MIMQIKHLLPAVFLLLTITVKATDDPKIIPSELKSVTVYRAGAELVHNTSVQLLQGNNEVVVQNISNYLDINSVQINCPSAVTILSVEFSNNYLVLPESSERIKFLKDSVEQV